MTRPVVTQSPDAGWIEWTGKESRAPEGMVRVRMRDGFECIAHTGTRWTHYDRPTTADIIAYRPVQSDAPAGDNTLSFGPWKLWLAKPPIGSREFDWHYAHDDYDGEGSPGWMTGAAPTWDACLTAIILQYEERVS